MRRALLALAALLVPLVPRAGLSAQDASRPVVEVVASGGPAVLEAMADRIRALESRFPISVRWSAASAIDVREIVAPRAAGEAVLTRVWLDMSDPRRAVLFIANAGHDRFLVRVVPASDGYGELTRESLATVVESAIDAFLAGGQIGIDRSAALRELAAQTGTQPAAEPAQPQTRAAEPKPEPVPSASALPASRPPWLLATYYRGDAIADRSGLRHAAQLALSYAVDVDYPFDLLLMVTTQLAPSFTLGDGGRQVEEHGGGARAAFGVTSRGAGVFGWQAVLGAGVDLLRVEPAIAADLELEAAQPFTATLPVATLLVTGSIRPAAWLDIAFGVGLDLDLAGHHFDVERASARAPLITPWRVHPYGLVGVDVPFGGGAQR